MGAEVAAGRLLAPAFGTSTLVWSALIGVVLGGLALGAMLGGRWSRRPKALRETFLAIAIAGILLVLLPAMARPLMRATLEQFLHGHLVLLVFGFASVLVLLVVPVILLGAASPVLLHCSTRDRADVGRTAGRLSALGTMGSLAGTFVCGIVLVPLFGTEATFRACGGLALCVGVLGFHLASISLPFWRRAAIVIAACLSGLASLVIPHATARGGSPALVQRETAQNYIRVIDDADHRTLYLNEGYAAQTIARHDQRAYLRGVWGYYAVAPAFTKRAPSRILVLGLGGGTSARDYKERLPTADVVAVEIDAGIVDVARTHFGLPGSVDVHVEDARAFLAHDTSTYDLVVVDAFQFPYVPFQLTTREFYEDVRRHLREGGAVMVNVGRKADQLDIVHAVASTLETAFPRVSGVNVRHTTNTILVATAHDLQDAGGAKNVSFSDEERHVLDELDPLAPWVVPASQRLVLTDDRAPVEWLTHRIVLRELARMAKDGSS
jgi:predicted membrane-bound spermidine synthase